MEIPFQSLIIPDAFVGPRLQAAVDQAANEPRHGQPRGAVWIPSTYAGDDTYSNPQGVPIFDMRFPGSISFANGALLPNIPLAFSATPSFNASQSHSYSMTLTANVTSSTITGTPQNGTLLSLTLVEDGTGGWTFAFPANFVFPVGFTFDTVANHTNALTFKFDGTNWNLVANSGSGAGNSPGAPTNSLQKNDGGGHFIASSIVDTGTAVTVGNATTFSSSAAVTGALNANSTATVGGLFTAGADSLFAGPNPYYDVRKSGARAVSLAAIPQTTGTINSGSSTLTLAAASTFQNGDGITIYGAGSTNTLSTPSAPTVVASNMAGPMRSGITVANSSGATTYQYQVIARTLFGAYTAPSSATSIANGPAALGNGSVSVTSWSRSGCTVTLNFGSSANLVTGAHIYITGSASQSDIPIKGRHPVTVVNPTQVTYADSTCSNVPSTTTNSVTATYHLANHISWAAVTGAWTYCIYGRTAGSMNLIGVSLPENSDSRVTPDPLYNTFDDLGYGTVTDAVCPVAMPSVATNNYLTTTIASGAGTTTLTLAGTASNSVVASAVIFDNTPTMTTAVNNTGRLGVTYVPTTAFNFGFYMHSPFGATGLPTFVSIMQAGVVQAADTVYIPGNIGVIWSGQPKVPNGSNPQFANDNNISLILQAQIGVYGSTPKFDHINLIGSQANGQTLFLQDSFGSIPGWRFEHVGFLTSGTSDCTSVHILQREDILGSAVDNLHYVNFGVGSCPASTDTPVFIRTRKGGIYTFTHVFTFRRGIYFGGGTDLTADDFYSQGTIDQPKITVGNFGGGTAAAISLNSSVEDTTSEPVLSYFGGVTGNATIPTNVITGVTVQGDSPGILMDFTGSVLIAIPGQNLNTIQSQAQSILLDGINNTAPSFTGSTQWDSYFAVGNSYSNFVESAQQAVPTCAVSAGGTVPIASYVFAVAPVFPSGGEGTMSPRTATCTTSSGQQTVTITWATVPNAIGYDLYKGAPGSSLFSFQCSPPWVANGTSTQYVWSGAAACGQSAPSTAGAGPTEIHRNGVDTASVNFGNQLKASLVSAPITVANRVWTGPDATGTILLDSTATSAAGLAPAPYDNFNRANGGLGANWTSVYSTNGAEAISGNTVIGGNGSSNTGSYWSANAFLNDQGAEVTVSTTTANSQGVLLRATGTTNATTNAYACVENGAAQLQITKISAGGVSSLTTGVITSAVGDRIRGTMVGTTITCSQTTVAGVVTTISTSDATFASGSPGIFNARNNGGLTNWTGFSLAKNAAFVTAEQEFNGHQHFNNGAITVGNIPTASTGTALTNGTVYSQALVLGNAGSQTNSLTSASGNSGKIAQSTGTLTSGNLAKFDANGNIVDATFAASNFLPDPGSNGIVARTAANTTAARTLQSTSGGALTWTNPAGTAGDPTPAFVFPGKGYFEAAGCNNATASPSWDLPTASAPTANCNTGSNIQEGTLDFADGQSAQFKTPLPSDWTGAIDASIFFFDSSTSGTVIWNIQTACSSTTGAATDDVAFNTADAFNTITLSTPSNAQWVASKTGINITGCSAGNLLQVKISRATDTAAAVARAKGVLLTIRRAL